eukprot:m.202176 g.202176  ORF g.202176 m.202176 type:complete len:672 (-) comp25978_c0_seq5:22-2037(-)
MMKTPAKLALLSCLTLLAAPFILYNFAQYQQPARELHRQSDGTFTYNSGNQQTNNHEACIAPLKLVTIVSNPEHTMNLLVMIKSLLFFRSVPIRLIILTNEIGAYKLNKLFQSWALPHVDTTIINVYKHPSGISTKKYLEWLPVYASAKQQQDLRLLALALPEYLPHESFVVYLDPHAIFNSDIFELWNQKSVLTGPIGKVKRNAGILLLNLEELRAQNFVQLWLKETPRLITDKDATFSSQSLLRLVVQQHPKLESSLDCEWSVHPSDLDVCHQPAKVVYWDGVDYWDQAPSTSMTIEELALRSTYERFQRLDGNGFRFSEVDAACPEVRFAMMMSTNKSDPCVEFQHAARETYRVLPFAVEFDHEQYGYPTRMKEAEMLAKFRSHMTLKDIDFTVITQFSYDRWHMFENLVTSWSGPVSATVYASDSEIYDILQQYRRSPHLRHRRNIAINFMFKEQRLYPFNIARNVAFDETMTSHVFLLDIDFMTSSRLYESLPAVFASLMNDAHIMFEKVAMVIPAFSIERHGLEPPINKSGLLPLWDQELVYPFYMRRFPQGHRPTDFDQWKTTQRVYAIDWDDQFEPYIAISRFAPRYDPRFVGYGYDKISHIMEVAATNHKFFVHPSAFVLHVPHPMSVDGLRFRKTKSYQLCIENNKNTFHEKLKTKYGFGG